MQPYTLTYEVYQEDDLWVALCLNLPGLGTQGDTEPEAHTMFQEAATLTLESYLADNQPIPWEPTEPYQRTPNSTLHTTTITIPNNTPPNQ